MKNRQFIILCILVVIQTIILILIYKNPVIHDIATETQQTHWWTENISNKL